MGAELFAHNIDVAVTDRGDDEWHIRLMCVPEEQGPIVDRLADYALLVTG